MQYTRKEDDESNSDEIPDVLTKTARNLLLKREKENFNEKMRERRKIELLNYTLCSFSSLPFTLFLHRLEEYCINPMLHLHAGEREVTA